MYWSDVWPKLSSLALLFVMLWRDGDSSEYAISYYQTHVLGLLFLDKKKLPFLAMLSSVSCDAIQCSCDAIQ